jgi:hypothetical protein
MPAGEVPHVRIRQPRPAQRPSKLDPFKPYLDQHAGGGHGSFTRLFHEIKALGYDGSYPVVRSGRQPGAGPAASSNCGQIPDATDDKPDES